MKRFIILLIVVGLYYPSYAQEYQIDEIEEWAYAFFSKSPQYESSRTIQKQISSIEAITRDSANYMYIVNTEDSAGWVILSNEKRYPIIVAHSDAGSFVYDKGQLPPALICILNNHMNVIDSVRSNRLQISNNIGWNARSSTDTISPTFLNAVKWEQSLNSDGNSADCDKVYNKFCPEVNKDTCENKEGEEFKTCYRKPAGCGAIAMAQLMKYWQWPDYANVRNNTYYYDWDNMPNEIDNNTEMYKIDEVARLIENCRTAAKSVGTCVQTGALISFIHDAMIDVFGYHSNLVRPKQENVDIPSMIVNEIKLQRPIIVQAFGDTLLKEAHTFIIDGYKKIGNAITYHVNFGWGGWRNDYYSLDFDGYYKNQTYLIELYPNCNTRSSGISLNTTDNILANDNRTYYSTNDIVFCSNNNAVTINNGGHLLVKSNGQVRLKSGFHAKAGSDVRITTTEPLCHTSQTASTVSQNVSPRRMSTADNSQNPMEMENNRIEGVNNEMIQSTSIYTISGQLVQTMEGELQNTSHLPNGMYILQHRISDGSIISTKITK